MTAQAFLAGSERREINPDTAMTAISGARFVTPDHFGPLKGPAFSG
jgi:hypothetical protein